LHAYVNPECTLKEFIKVYKNCISEDLCDSILSEYTANESEWGTSYVMRPTGHRTGDNDFRNSRELFITSDEVINRNFNVRKQIDEDLFNIFGSVIKDYVATVSPFLPISRDTGYSLLAYDPGCYFKQHIDVLSYPENAIDGLVSVENALPRRVSLSLFLNDDYEGGDLSFFDATYTIPKQKGTVVLFPSNCMFPHQVHKVTSGCRYSIVTWFC